jgi:hypothetical protein
MTNDAKPLTFAGDVLFQFMSFAQREMSTASDGSQVFTGVASGAFGTPPTGTRFDATIKLSVGAGFADDAYEILLHPALANLAAKPAVRKAVFDYANACMSSMLGPQWVHMTGLTAMSNLIPMPSPMFVVSFDETNDSW